MREQLFPDEILEDDGEGNAWGVCGVRGLRRVVRGAWGARGARDARARGRRWCLG